MEPFGSVSPINQVRQSNLAVPEQWDKQNAAPGLVSNWMLTKTWKASMDIPRFSYFFEMPMLNRNHPFVHQWKFVNFTGGSTWPLHVCSMAFWCLPKSHRAMEKSSCCPSGLNGHVTMVLSTSNLFGKGRDTAVLHEVLVGGEHSIYYTNLNSNARIVGFRIGELPFSTNSM